MTKLDYLKRLPEDYNGLPLRKLALENYSPTFSKRVEVDNLHDALCIGIEWHKTAQGYSFWEKIAIAADRGELQIVDSQIKMTDEIKRLKKELKEWKSQEVKERFGRVNSQLHLVTINELQHKIKRLKRGEDI
jgi:hypothetical protein